MSDFVRMHLLKQLNYRNPMTRLDNLESGKIQPSATVAKMSDLSSNMGEVITGKFNFYNPTTGQLVGYLTSTPDPAYPNYYMVALDASGNVQFSVDPSTSGATTMGNGAVTINESGVSVANVTASYIWKDAAGNTNTIYANATTDNLLTIYNNATSGVIKLITSSTDGGISLYASGAGGYTKQTITLSDATTPSVVWQEHTSEANTAAFRINSGVFPTEVTIGGNTTPGIKMRANLDGNETVFNETSYDINFRVEGAADANLFVLDAGLDEIGIGTNAPGSKLDVAGSFQCDSITNDTGLAHGTWTPTATAGTNVAASTDITPNISNYIRVGNQVFFNGSVTIDTTAIGAFTCYLTIPIASNFNSNFDANGNGTQPGTGVPNIFSIREDQVNDRLQLDGYSQTAAAVFYRFAGGYIVK